MKDIKALLDEIEQAGFGGKHGRLPDYSGWQELKACLGVVGKIVSPFCSQPITANTALQVATTAVQRVYELESSMDGRCRTVGCQRLRGNGRTEPQ